MSKVTITWSLKNGNHCFDIAGVSPNTDKRVMACGMECYDDIVGVMKALVTTTKSGIPQSPDAQMVINFYLEEGKLTTDYKMTLPPTSQYAMHCLQAVGLLVNEWMKDHFAKAIERKAVIMDRFGNITRKAI